MAATSNQKSAPAKSLSPPPSARPLAPTPRAQPLLLLLLACALLASPSRAADLGASAARAGGEALLAALVERRAGEALSLLGAGADANYADANGFTPLHVASYSCGAEMRSVARALLAAGADATAANVGGISPLVAACSAGDEELAGLLLARGAAGVEAARDSRSADAYDYTGGLNALDICEASGLASTAAALRAAGATGSPAAAALGSRAAIACRVLLWACRDRCDAAALRLLRVDANATAAEAAAAAAAVEVTCADDAGMTPLHWAVNAGAGDVAEALLGRGADPMRRDMRGQTSLDMVQAIEDRGTRERLAPQLARMREEGGEAEEVAEARQEL